MRHLLLLLALPSFAAAEPGFITPAVQEALTAIQSAFPRPLAVTRRKAAPGSATVRSEWRRYSYDGPSQRSCDCFPALQALDYLLERLPVRGVSQSVFCQQGRGYISASFEYLGTSPY